MLDKHNIQLLLVSIGTPQRGLEFCAKTGYDPTRFLADPDSTLYDALALRKGVKETFFSYDTPKAIWEDIKTGRIKRMQGVLKKWTKQELWIPPRVEQSYQQGGIVVFDGANPVWAWRDPATGAHADMQTVLDVALNLP